VTTDAPTQRLARAEPTTPPQRPRGGIGRWILVIVLVVAALGLLALFLLARFVSGFNPFERETVDRTQPAVLLALQDLSEYRAATGEFQVIVDTQDQVRNLPLAIAGERTLFVAGGTVDAAVDFSNLGPDAVVVDDRQRVTISLPAAELTEATVDPDNSYVFSRERGILDRVAGMFNDNPTSERELYQTAEAKLETAAVDSGLKDLAERNTEAMLRSLLTSLGFTDIVVTFE
jgi:Protein of unknown function (DUF4230)